MKEITKEKLKYYGACAASCLLGAACFGVCPVVDEVFWMPAMLGGLAFVGIGARGFYDAYNIFQGDETEANAKTSRDRTNVHEQSKSHSLSKVTVKSENKGGLLTRAFARPAKGKTPEEKNARERKATKLLETLRERDANGKKVSVKNYKSQREGR